MWLWLEVSLCVCVCVKFSCFNLIAFFRLHCNLESTSTPLIYLLLDGLKCVCVCVCVRERGWERERDLHRGKGTGEGVMEEWWSMIADSKFGA